MATEYYLGLMAGTSLDAIDCALVSFENGKNFQLIQNYSENLSANIRSKLLSLTQPQHNELELLLEMDVEMGHQFAQACLKALDKSRFSANQIQAIGSHGQTIRHCPHGEFKTTLQIGDANIIAELTGITTIADFRRRDMAAGGQGAPLVPPFHAALFRDTHRQRCVVNIGGIANITTLPAEIERLVTGFDTGPGNSLIDIWCQLAFNSSFDKNGDLARNGRVSKDLLQRMLSDSYFSMLPPKSTGREYFGKHWLTKHLQSFFLEQSGQTSEEFFKQIDASNLTRKNNQICIDILTTLTELTAISISNQILQALPNTQEVLVCGGGSKNSLLMERISHHLPVMDILLTGDYGLPADCVESSAFAWLAMKTMHNQTGNLPSVTGAKHPVTLGAIYPAGKR